ncbi:MAG: DUF1648 domain-containing protein [Salinibacterium sp.]|nr:DUF1648 domain-containing protein [Salinibacterium sp.]
MKPHARMLVAGVIVPLIIAAAAAVTMLFTLPSLPDPVAVHWGPSGAPDNFGSPVSFIVVILVAVLAYCAFALVISRAAGPQTANLRALLAISPFLATVLGVLGAGSLIIQQGLADAHDAPSILPLVIIGFVVGLVVGVAAWFFLPASTPVPVVDEAELPLLDLGADERATWIQRVEPARWLGILLVAVGAIVVVGGSLAVWVSAPTSTFVGYLVTMGVLVVLVTSTLFWTVRVDARGFAARSPLGFPRFTVPLADVESATTIELNPATGFGGWGLRWGGPGRFGIILNSGEALEIRKKSGGSLVVTTAQSRQGAALLNSLVRRVE